MLLEDTRNRFLLHNLLMKVNNMFDNRPVRLFSSLRSSQIREHTFKCVTVVAAGGFSPGL